MDKTIAMLPPDPMNSLSDTSAVFFSDLVRICGLMCIITRLVPQIKWMHKWFGKGYIIAMLWADGTSLVIHNTCV